MTKARSPTTSARPSERSMHGKGCVRSIVFASLAISVLMDTIGKREGGADITAFPGYDEHNRAHKCPLVHGAVRPPPTAPNRLSRLPAKILRLRFQHSRSTVAPFAERNHASETHHRRRARSSDGVRNHAARRDLVRTGPPHIGRRHCRACEALLRVSSVQVRRRVRACRESRSAVAVSRHGTAAP